MLLIAGILFVCAANAQLKTPPASSFQSVKQSFALSEISVEYSRPNVNKRTVYGGLVPFDKIWRTGANASTKITFGEDVKINGKDLPAGTYALLSIPGRNNWELLFYSDTRIGANVAAYDKSKEVLRVNAKPQKINWFFETFTVLFTDVKPNSLNVDLVWENTKVSFNVSAEIDARIMASIDDAMTGDKPPYFQAAAYYYDNNKDLSKALNWANTAAEQNPNAYWIQALKAKIELKKGDKKAAAVTAQKVIDLATEGKNNDYVAIGKDLLQQAKK